MALKNGNPSGTGGARKGAGRPKGLKDEVRKEIKELAGQYREEALSRLAYWMRSENPKASVAASIALLDRSDGKPAQMIGEDKENPFKGAVVLLPPQEIGERGGIVS